ncbi:hypothetical protein QCA50_018992 [Cerrena zonata]|uniref:Protein-S-isoprenylcysteine O-methyltransferase n=1 Tax=Cerrena zonata TaxID=2478898 RepID=A0AAW0FCE5_9APHY
MSRPSLTRLLLTLLNVAFAFRAGTPPNPPPKIEDRRKYERDKSTKDLMTPHLWWFIPLGLSTLFFPHLVEIYVIFTAYFPALSSRIIDTTIVHYASPPATVTQHLQVSSTYLFGTVLNLTGSVLRLFCYQALGRHFTFELSLRDDHKLITTGPYSLVRHPSYTGNFLIVAGLLVCQWGEGSWWKEFGIQETVIGSAWDRVMTFVVVIYTIVMVNRTGKEDTMLRKEFKGQWERWSQKTPYKLVPGVY